jgi:hypothetical protein
MAIYTYPGLYLVRPQVVLERAGVDRGVVGKNVFVAFTADVNQLIVRPCSPVPLTCQRG